MRCVLKSDRDGNAGLGLDGAVNAFGVVAGPWCHVWGDRYFRERWRVSGVPGRNGLFEFVVTLYFEKGLMKSGGLR